MCAHLPTPPPLPHSAQSSRVLDSTQCSASQSTSSRRVSKCASSPHTALSFRTGTILSPGARFSPAHVPALSPAPCSALDTAAPAPHSLQSSADVARQAKHASGELSSAAHAACPSTQCYKQQGTIMIHDSSQQEQLTDASSMSSNSPAPFHAPHHHASRRTCTCIKASDGAVPVLSTTAGPQVQKPSGDAETDWEVIGEFCSRTVSKGWLRQSLWAWQAAAKTQVKWRSISQVS